MSTLPTVLPRLSASVLLELPITVVQRAHLAGLQPPGDAVEVECMVADAPGDGALLAGSRGLIGLALDAKIHDVVAADGTVVDNNVPSPERDSVPLLHLEALLRIGCLAFNGGGLLRGNVGHVDVGHDDYWWWGRWEDGGAVVQKMGIKGYCWV